MEDKIINSTRIICDSITNEIIEDEKDRLLQNLRTKIEVPKLF